MESQSREGKKQRSDQAQEGDPTSKRPRIDFATRQYQLHELQQQSKGKELENTDQLKERSVDEQSKSTEKPSGLYPSWSHSMNDVINDVTWDNMEFREVLARQQAEEARKQQQEAGPSHQGDPSSPSNHLELSIDDFELCSLSFVSLMTRYKFPVLKAYQRSDNRLPLTILPKPNVSSNGRTLWHNDM